MRGLAYWESMGVFHMAMPSAGLQGRRPPVVRGGGERPADGAPQLPRMAATGGTAQPEPGGAGGGEARVRRTAEQQAEQDALALLVVRCVAGDQGAWRQLVTGQHRRVYGLCYRFLGSAMEAEDVTQEVFLKMYRNLRSFDGERGSLQTWITTLTRNLLVDHYRRTRQERLTESMDAAGGSDEDGPTLAERLADRRPGQEQQVAGLELRARVQEALKKISPELREAVILRDLEDMDYKEIAVVLRIPEGTVKSRISRGRGELARLLQRMEGKVV